MGVDVRNEGSGNIGATNVARSAGRRLGAMTLAADTAKGAIPVAAALAIDPGEWVVAATGVAAVLGHVSSVFLRFRGGKGVATGAGVLVAMAPLAAALPIAVFAAVFALRRIVALASIGAALFAPFALWLVGYPTARIVAAVVIVGLIVARHSGNLSRLASGDEPEFRASE